MAENLLIVNILKNLSTNLLLKKCIVLKKDDNKLSFDCEAVKLYKCLFYFIDWSIKLLEK